MRRRFGLLWLLLLALALGSTSGCGDDGGKIVFLECGNSVVDGDEECDDGNVSNNDDCLTTCVFATCGDKFVHAEVEECDGTNLNFQTCASQGFASGDLRCTSGCQFDTSQCSGVGPTTEPGTPTPAATSTPAVTSSAATPTGGETPTPNGSSPTATPTPGGGAACQQGDMLTVTIAVAFDDTSFPDVTGGTTSVQYPAGLDVPGNQSSTDQARGTNLTGTSGGFFNISDQDSNRDNVDDQVVVGLVGTQAFAPGNFASVQFDCVSGTTIPSASSFTCTPDLSTNSGTTVTGASCSVASVTGP